MRKRVLVLDDEETLARSVARVLYANFDVDIFLHASDALKALETHSYDCVVSDVMMSGMSGPEFYSMAVTLHPYLKGRFMFFTGTPLEILHGDVPFLTKPADVSRLRGMVELLST